MQFFYVKIPLDPAAPQAPGLLPGLHQTLETALTARQAGSLLGWGDSVELGPSAGAGLRPSFHRIDVEVGDHPALARALLRDTLAGCAVPPGTELHYSLDGQALQEVYRGGAAGWGDPQPSSGALHAARRRT